MKGFFIGSQEFLLREGSFFELRFEATIAITLMEFFIFLYLLIYISLHFVPSFPKKQT